MSVCLNTCLYTERIAGAHGGRKSIRYPGTEVKEGREP